jgi:2-C-methyl-D-erythritol 2,4-cyclodiphosphate synthase
VPGRKLVLGGVEIPYERGLLGHSDGDVLLHAIADALLGAAGKGDIGQYFPSSDRQYKGISSLKLLETVAGLLQKDGFSVVNVDATVLAEGPPLSPYFEAMKKKIAPVLGLDARNIGVKATTQEGLGAVGRGEGMAALAVALVKDEAL